MAVRFFDQHTQSRLKNKRKLSAFIQHLIHKEKSSTIRIDLSYIFCTDDRLWELNKKYLQHDTLTDVISFDFSENGQKIYGEIYISTERVQENAKLYQTSYHAELLRVIFHGVLHLCGYQDKAPGDKERMTDRENFYLNKYLHSSGSPS